MTLNITTLVLIAGAIFAALAAALSMAGAVHVTARREHGYFHLVFYAILFVVALTSITSGRDLTTMAWGLETPEVEQSRSPLMSLIQPVASLFILTLSGERIISRWLHRESGPHPHQFLFLTFLVFWIGTVAAPALFSANPKMSHDFVYPLVIGSACVLATGKERDMAFRATRNALVIFMIASLVMIPLQPSLVMDASYAQGLLDGVPRLAGLAPHAVSMGLLSQLALTCLLVYPYRKKWVNRLVWVLGLSVLFIAQSKTGWIAFFLCSLCILLVKDGPPLWRRISDPRNPVFGVAAVLSFMVGFLLLGAGLLLTNLDAKLSNFFNTDQGAMLVTMTGRDQIWAIAWDEWERNPIFGYGPSIWDFNYRTSIGMLNATHAHNQFMDTLSRSGTVGAASLVFYAVVLLVCSIRYAGRSQGLTLALFLGLVLRSVSEVPLHLFGYGPELIAQVLLLMVIAGCASEQSKENSVGVRASAEDIAKRSRGGLGTARCHL
jgi:O-antigen ligase